MHMVLKLKSSHFFIGFILLLLHFVVNSISAQSLCWSIKSDKSKKVSYLYGTMHVKDKRVFNISENVLKAMSDVDLFALEVNPEKMELTAIMQMMLKGTGRSIKASLTDTEYYILDSLCKKKIKVSVSVFDNMQPIILQAFISTSDDYDTTLQFLDMHMYKLSQKSKKEVTGIETMEEQISAFQALGYDEQIELLKKELNEATKSEDDFEKMIKFYNQGDIDSLLVFSEEYNMPTKLSKVLIEDRNIKMADRIEKIIKRQSLFAAVGALHLPGANGIINILRKKGYRVEVFK
jgi:uncharacterized protein YbaP (TraB family)